MTVLSKNDIEEHIEEGEIELDAQRGPAIEPASMDLHLGRKLKYPAKRDDTPVSVDDKETYPEYASVDSPRPLVREGSFALATTEESLTIPNGLVAFLHGRSSIGRLGLTIENAGLIDPGFSGQVTMEFMNEVDYDIELVAGMRIGQLTFHKIENAPEVGYSEHNGNKYDGQIGPTVSRLYEDFE
jgi:dCTP deaminase